MATRLCERYFTLESVNTSAVVVRVTGSGLKSIRVTARANIDPWVVGASVRYRF